MVTGVITAPAAPGARRGHFGAWRAVSAAPAMAGSLALLLVLFGWMGQWEGLLLVGWVASGVATFSRSGERVAVAVGCGFRRPKPHQVTALAPVWAAAMARAGIEPAGVELYVQRSGELNAYSVGGRSVAVTTGVLREFVARRLGSSEMEGVLVHELGHHLTRATRFTLLSLWLAAPWRFASRLMIGIGLAAVGRRQPRPLLALVTVAVVVIAVVQSVQQGQIAAPALLAAMLVCAAGCPLADAWLARRSEFAADRFAAERGAGRQLAAALRNLDRRPRRKRTWTQRALSRHPSTQRRIQTISTYST